MIQAVTQIWEVRLLIETDDEADVERIADAVGKAACPHDALAEPDHACPVPWFVIRSPLYDQEASFWRDALNR
jgi:hypothetical protein